MLTTTTKRMGPTPIQDGEITTTAEPILITIEAM